MVVPHLDAMNYKCIIGSEVFVSVKKGELDVSPVAAASPHLITDTQHP